MKWPTKVECIDLVEFNMRAHPMDKSWKATIVEFPLFGKVRQFDVWDIDDMGAWTYEDGTTCLYKIHNAIDQYRSSTLRTQYQNETVEAIQKAKEILK